LVTLNLDSINLTNMPGQDLWTVPGKCRDRRVPSFQNNIDPDTKQMSQDSTSAGVDYQLNRTSVFRVHYVHNHLRNTIEDLTFAAPDNNEGYVIGNPGEGLATLQFHKNANPNITPCCQALPKAIRQYDALEIGYDR